MASFMTKRTIIILLSIISLFLVFYFILPVSVPLITAFVTALMLSPAVQALRKRTKIRRNMSVAIVFTSFICFIGLTGYFITTKAISQGTAIIEKLPQFINDINRAWWNFQRNLENEYENLPPELVQEINIQVSRSLNQLRGLISERNLIDDLTLIISSIPHYFITFIVYLIALFLFMMELPSLKEKLFTYFSEKTKEKVNFMTSRLSDVFWGFFKAQLQVSILIFIVAFIGLLFISPDVALFMAFIIWIIDVIPLIGSIIILAPWAAFQFIAGNIALGTHLLILAAILLVIRRTVEPKVMGQNIGLSPLATLIAMYLGVIYFGVIGFFIGPLLVIAITSAKEAGLINFHFKL
ncbi:sporulation integral membrane protein YtvI [bacterium LRH843]|nr:sporulation integral membrane protein YtvI [bacterium LRH843]